MLYETSCEGALASLRLSIRVGARCSERSERGSSSGWCSLLEIYTEVKPTAAMTHNYENNGRSADNLWDRDQGDKAGARR
jgi:hypothetical protein